MAQSTDVADTLDIFAPLVGRNIWGFRVGMIVISAVLIISYFIDASQGVVALLVVAVVVSCAFELCVAVYRMHRLRIYTDGLQTSGRLTAKAITPRGSLHKLRIAYELDGREYVASGYVSEKIYWQHAVGDQIEIRASLKWPRCWVIAHSNPR